MTKKYMIHVLSYLVRMCGYHAIEDLAKSTNTERSLIYCHQ